MVDGDPRALRRGAHGAGRASRRVGGACDRAVVDAFRVGRPAARLGCERRSSTRVTTPRSDSGSLDHATSSSAQPSSSLVRAVHDGASRRGWSLALRCPLTVSAGRVLPADWSSPAGSLQQMSIFGMMIALGLLIDNAIVIVDEVGAPTRRKGLPRADAGRNERDASPVLVPLLASTLTTVLSFAPIPLLIGNVGDFVGPIGVSRDPLSDRIVRPLDDARARRSPACSSHGRAAMKACMGSGDTESPVAAVRPRGCASSFHGWGLRRPVRRDRGWRCALPVIWASRVAPTARQPVLSAASTATCSTCRSGFRATRRSNAHVSRRFRARRGR